MDDIIFTCDDQNLKSLYTMTLPDGRLALVFTPTYERVDKSDTLVLKSGGQQMFGRCKVKGLTISGEKLDIIDLIGWVEEYNAKW